MSQTTAELRQLLDAWAQGPTAELLSQLVVRSEARLRILAGRLLRRDRVRIYENTDDVLQEAMVRLLRALEKIEPESVTDFMGLSALQIRRTLLDLARHHFGPGGPGERLMRAETSAIDAAQLQRRSRNEPSEQAELREAWCSFYETIDQLGDDERRVFDLLWTHGLSQGDAAEMLRISQSEVSRRWQRCRRRLGSLLAEYQDQLLGGIACDWSEIHNSE